MGNHFVARWMEQYPTGKIIWRDLQANQIPHLKQSTVQAFFSDQPTVDELALSDALIHEIMISDELLITCPMYNFQIPSSLKAYLDHVVRVKKTFLFKDGEYVGLLKNKRCSILTTMGGQKEDVNREEGFESYLRNILAFVGITDTHIFCVDGTANPAYATPAMVETKNRILKSI
jgi:FMN-dependent NADH-azoreductase